jgi:TonB family protein
MFMQSENYEPQIDLAGLEAHSSPNRGRQIVFALVLFITVLILFAVKYRTFWFDPLSSEGAANQTSSDATQEREREITPAKSRKNGIKQHTVSVPEAETAPSSSLEATVLPPLQADVTYSNGRHQTLVARDSAVRLSFSPQTAEALVRPVDPVYPLLAQQTNVQGSVVLSARVGQDGSVQSVQVVSGPDILANAAVEAIKQWRFKPRDEAGQLVPAETRITVNFNISTPGQP